MGNCRYASPSSSPCTFRTPKTPISLLPCLLQLFLPLFCWLPLPWNVIETNDIVNNISWHYVPGEMTFSTEKLPSFWLFSLFTNAVVFAVRRTISRQQYCLLLSSVCFRILILVSLCNLTASLFVMPGLSSVIPGTFAPSLRGFSVCWIMEFTRSASENELF